jgi:small subunit ribosomal protein S5
MDSNDLFQEEVISIRRVTKVVKGGKNMRFSAAVVVGDKNGQVGLGKGKAREVPLAIKKAVADAKKNLFNVPIINETIPYYKVGSYGGSKVVMRPASPGTGVIAGGSVRIIMELAGVKNILTKILKSKNSITVAGPPCRVCRSSCIPTRSPASAARPRRSRGSKKEDRISQDQDNVDQERHRPLGPPAGHGQGAGLAQDQFAGRPRKKAGNTRHDQKDRIHAAGRGGRQ